MNLVANYRLPDQAIVSALSPFGVHANEDQVCLVREYVQLLMKWNRAISLTTIQEPVEIVARHFGESMFAQSVIPMETGCLVDVGTGAGFPGLALKIAVPALRVCLIESNHKKAAFLAEVVRSLGLSDVEILAKRFEEARPAFGLADFITARALGGFSDLLRWAGKALLPRGKVILWVGQDDASRIAEIPGWIWQPAIKIPESQRRYLLVGRTAPSGAS